MHMGTWPPNFGLTRRGFLLGAGTGVAAGAAGTWLGLRGFGRNRERPAPAREVARPEYTLPGRYPGRVVEVRHPAAVSPAHVIDRQAVAGMVDQGMGELTGAEPADVRAAWGRFFQKGDVVGIKVNPVGRKPKPGEGGRNPNSVGSISSFELLYKVVESLKAVGVHARDVIVFERYALEFCDAGYADFVRAELPGVRWYASAVQWSAEQVDVAGFDGGRDNCSPELARHVVGYDPDVFTAMGFCAPEHSKRDDRRFRSHLSLIVTRLVNKVINLPVLKDHRSAGVTLALKNLSHGMNNNVNRSHTSGIAHGFGPSSMLVTGPNQCNTFIPQCVAQHRLREKVTLHILDGLIGVYEGGPGNWNKTWGTWRHRGLLFATDPVALDHVGWDLIDAKRAQMGWPAVEKMGWLNQTPAAQVTTALAPLATRSPVGAAALAAAAHNREGGWSSEVFNVRQPEHVILAGQLGLGVFDRDQIDYRLVSMTSDDKVTR
jgi:hypothetical protein